MAQKHKVSFHLGRDTVSTGKSSDDSNLWQSRYQKRTIYKSLFKDWASFARRFALCALLEQLNYVWGIRCTLHGQFAGLCTTRHIVAMPRDKRWRTESVTENIQLVFYTDVTHIKHIMEATNDSCYGCYIPQIVAIVHRHINYRVLCHRRRYLPRARCILSETAETCV